MDSKPDRRTLIAAVIAVALSALAFHLSMGLQPRWWPIWFASLPLLWVARRLRWWEAGLAALLARSLGGLGTWSYYEMLQIPLAIRLEALLAPALAFALAVLLFRRFMDRQRPWLAAFVFPSVIVAYEYLSSLQVGTFGNSAYTQIGNVPALQLGALAGLWGITFAVMLVAPLLASVLSTAGATRKRLALGLVIFLGGVFGYGAARAWVVPAHQSTLRVGLVVSDLAKNERPAEERAVLDLMRGYADQAKQLVARGAQVIVLPEMTALVADSTSREVDELFANTANGTGAEILVGVLHATPDGTFNEARLYSDARPGVAVYRKHHLVPVVEGGTTSGDGIYVHEHSRVKIGLEICRDMDYPDPARRYGSEDVGLVLVPAWDFDVDRYWHGHMALMRGVENGFSIVRAAKRGLLLVGDNRARVLAETPTTAATTFTTLIADVPAHHSATLYQRWGDWFAWANLALLTGLLAMGARRATTLAFARPTSISPPL